jgi:tetratricopeptide (TPR) repeat protein
MNGIDKIFIKFLLFFAVYSCAAEKQEFNISPKAPQIQLTSSASVKDSDLKSTPEPIRNIIVSSVSSKTEPINTAEINNAFALAKQGEQSYRNGQYEEAEKLLKEALSKYPFLASANLLLGKILLLRASASRDMDMMQSARLMFEMANTLDPSLREAKILLELFTTKVVE